MTVKTSHDNLAVKHKTLQVKFTSAAKAEDDEYYHFEGYGAVFGNIDSYGDVILKGAFVDSLKEMQPRLCYQHWMSDVIGVIDEAFEDDKGLYIKCRIPKMHMQGASVASLIKCGGLNEMSIGYSEVNVSTGTVDERRIQYLEKLKLYEISVVSHAANKEALITSFKSEDIKSIKDAETILRENGFSAKQAKTMISKIKEISKRDAKEEEVEEPEAVEAKKANPPTEERDAASLEEEKLLQKLKELTLNRQILNLSKK